VLVERGGRERESQKRTDVSHSFAVVVSVVRGVGTRYATIHTPESRLALRITDTR
jgi:hypothetical protein